VEAGSVGTFEMLMPLLALGETGYAPSPRIDVSGYAVVDGDLHFPSRSVSHQGSPYVAMSSTLATRSWGPLTEQLKTGSSAVSKQLVGSEINAAALPLQWRGLLGIGCLWLTDAEVIALRPEQRAAIRDWLAQGGELFCCTQALASEVRKELGLVLNQSSEAHVGFGRVKLIPWDGHELPASAIVPELNGVSGNRLKRVSAGYEAGEPIADAVGALSFNVPFLIVFITAFAAIVGPLNLYWLAGGARRHRLFWTTPLISLAASLLLVVVIVLQDGFGGIGKRVLLTYVLPGEKKAVILQEQITRTGVLLGREFDVQEDVFLTPLLVPTRGGKSDARNYHQSGRRYGSEWFSSRSVEAHLATAVVPTRAEIRVLNADQISQGQAPVIISHIPVTLRELVILDRNMARWVASNVRTGERTTLTRATGKWNAVFPKSAVRSSVHLSNLLSSAPAAEHFYAIAEKPEAIETLRSIRWSEEGIYLGPLTFEP
jgi:hypothetical protein